jgi:hypothetical protein
MATKKDLEAQGYEKIEGWFPSLENEKERDEIWRSQDKMKYCRVTPSGKAYEFISRGVE